MIATQIEIEPQMGGLVMLDIQLVRQIIIQMILLNRLYEPLTLTAISAASPSLTSPMTLQTRFDSVRSLETNELNTLYSMDASHRHASAGVGENILAAIATSIIYISALRARVTTIARSLKYLCSEENK